MILLFIGCSLGGDSGVSTSLEITVPPPSLDLESSALQIREALSLGIPDPEEARLTYLDWRQNGDTFCPGHGYQLQGIIEPCTTSEGYVFSGMATMMGATNDLSFPDSFEMGADCYILDPEGNRFVAAGDLRYESTGSHLDGVIETLITGTWESPSEEGWLGQDNSLWLTQLSSWEEQDWSITLDGSYRVGETSLRFDNFNIGSGCIGGQGELQMRDPNGYWLTLPFPDDCSACSEATYNDQSLGSICLDLSEYFEAEYQSLRLSR
jgi:hypothetical protein